MESVCRKCYDHGGAVRAGALLGAGATVAIAVGEWVHSGERFVLLPEGPWWIRLCSYLMLAVVSCLAVAYDYDQLGPTLAFWHGGVAAVVAWVFAVPLGLFSGFLIRCVWIVSLCGIGFMSAYASTQSSVSFPIYAFACVCILVASLWLAFSAVVQEYVTHNLGCVVIFLATYVLVRLLMMESSASAGTASFKGVEEVPKDSDEFEAIREAFELGCVAWLDKYDFWLHVSKAYRKQLPVENLVRTGEGKHLFHGTRWESAQGILSDGFRLPGHAGMFGKGIYFADCPLKSWRYTDGKPWRPGVILYCWVELGNSKHAKNAMTSLSRPPRRNLLEWLRGNRRYDSVVGDDQGAGGSLRVPEYIVYDPARVEVDYVLEVWSVPKGTPPPE